MGHIRDVWINSDSESIPIQFSIFCEFWVESETEEAEVNWVWIESRMCWIHRLSNNKPRQDTIWSICIEALRHIIHSELYSSGSTHHAFQW